MPPKTDQLTEYLSPNVGMLDVSQQELQHVRVYTFPFNHPLQRSIYRYFKRAFDVFFSLIIIFGLLSWLLPLFALIIRMDSKGPVFFTQIRHGLNSRQFSCLKLRTMVINKEADTRQAHGQDPRITRLGRIMRKYNLDELPQFINVLKGDMSIVGPRPHMIQQTLFYENEIFNYRDRLVVKPGITGLAQVSGSQGPTPTIWHMQRRVRYDLLYIKKWSFGLDLKIVFLTVYNLLHRTPAK